MGILDKAKGAKDAAAAKMAEIKDQAVAKAGDLKDQAVAAAGDLKDSAAQKFHEAVDASVGKLKESLGDFESALPAVAAIGYTVGTVRIELGVAPKIIATFVAHGPLTAEIVEEVVQKHADKRLAVMLVRTLYQARRLQDSIHIGGLRPTSIGVQIGVLPTVIVDFEAVGANTPRLAP
jgi:hypothetical protein